MTDTQSFIDPQRLGVGEPDNTKYLRGDQTWAVPDAGGISTITITERAAAADTTVSAGSSNSGTASCNAGEVSIGGGASVTGSAGNFSISESRRSSTTGWTTTYRNESGSSRTFRAYVICLATS